MLKNLEPKLEEAQGIPTGGRTSILDLTRVGNVSAACELAAMCKFICYSSEVVFFILQKVGVSLTHPRSDGAGLWIGPCGGNEMILHKSM